MRKIALIITLLMAGLLTQAKELNEYDYVVTNTTTYYCENIKMGVSTTKVKLINGEPLMIKNDEILAFKKNGKIFEKIPLYCHNKYIGRSGYAELVAYKSGLKLFKYDCYLGKMQMKCASNPCDAPACDLVVFKNGQYHLEVTETNYKTVFGFFGLKLAAN